MSSSGGLLGRLRQPEYTGANRCLPCTAVNLLIAAVGGAALATGLATVVDPGPAIAAGVLAIAASAGLVYLRGYLVPGTPALTKRYAPTWFLAAFGKAPDDGGALAGDASAGGARAGDQAAAGGEHPAGGEVDPETELVRAGALEECADREDLCLTDAFRRAWHVEMDALGTEVDRERLLALLDVDTGEVTYREFGEAFRASVNGDPVGTWESRAAFLADLASAATLEGAHPDWDGLSRRARSQLLAGLRLFVDVCPACGGTPDFGTETVESCCSRHDVAAVECADCGARLFESRVDEV
jgi:hypothetical protein